MSTPFKLTARLDLPGTPGLPQDPISFILSAQYDSKMSGEYVLPASTGTQAINFGTLPAAGVKGLLLYYEPSNDSPPIAVTINGGNQPIEISTGGFLLVSSPVPVDGVISMSIAYTGAGKVRVWLLA